MHCSECGSENPRGRRYCGDCGCPLEMYSRPRSQSCTCATAREECCGHKMYSRPFKYGTIAIGAALGLLGLHTFKARLGRRVRNTRPATGVAR
jgi:hypothetical protein